MAVIVHGVPGLSLRDAQVGDRDSVRQGAWFEEQTGQALERWLDGRPETFHLFHDLCGLVDVEGAGLKPISLGVTNIDHLILTGAGWVMIDAKGCAGGTLRVVDGRGLVEKADGTNIPQPWLDDAKYYSRAGVPYRLTEGKAGWSVFVVPDAVSFDESLSNARAVAKSGTFTNLAEVFSGALDELLPPTQLPVDPADVERLLAYVYALNPTRRDPSGEVAGGPE